MTMMLIDSENFRRRCASALTHPVTLAALVALLLNDALFKSLWPDALVTGKLSDLAWLVFASPLLAFILSLFLGRSVFGRRATIIIAYVGLPLLYAAFNTFETIHDGILWGLSRVAGGTAGSPLDPSDSLVIPFGLGIAVWVLRRRPAGRDRLRVRLALLAAGVATFATVATSYPVPGIGVGGVGVAEDGSIVADTKDNRRSVHYRSQDGGLSWELEYYSPNIEWGGMEVETPRGKFVIQGYDVLVLTVDGEWKVIYSATDFQVEANIWVQEQTTPGVGIEGFFPKPYSITYDVRSGNVVVATGLQGVVVGSPEGQWSAVAVGDHSPTDFSFAGKARALLSNGHLWVTALALSVSMTAISLVFAQYRRDAAALGISVTVAIFASLIGLPYLFGLLELIEGPAAVLLLLICTLIGSAIYLKSKPKGSGASRGIALGVTSALGIITLTASGTTLLLFGVPGGPPADGIFLFATLTVLFAIATMTVFWRQLRPRKAVLSAFAGMNGLVILVFLMWVQLGFGLTFAKISAFVLVALVALALTRHVRRKQQPEQGAD